MISNIRFYPKDPVIKDTTINGTLQHLQQKHNLVKQLNPKIIVELGVRAGYAAQAFLLACPTAKYIGFDANNGIAGGASDKRYTDFAKQQLASYDAIIYDNFDTQKHDKLPIEYADFIHIDADHTTEGALHDLNICNQCIDVNSVILVDDYDMYTVSRAVTKYLDNNTHMSGIAISKKNYVIFNCKNIEFPKIISK